MASSLDEHDDRTVSRNADSSSQTTSASSTNGTNSTEAGTLCSSVAGQTSSDAHLVADSNKSHGFVLKEKQGDLFKEAGDDVSLAHCVSVDLRMGKGIATVFKNMFGGLRELRSQNVKVGGTAVLKRDNRFIYYLVTKEKFSDKPTYISLENSLCAMRDHCISHNVQQLAMPRIGCGLDRLQWPRVVNKIKDVFQETNINVTVYSL